MLKALVTAGAYTANTNIPFNLVEKTNNKVSFDNATNTFYINETGLEWVEVNISLTPSATGLFTVQMYADGQPVVGATWNETFATATSTKTAVISDVIRIVPSMFNRASITFQATGDATLIDGSVKFLYVD